MERKVKILMLGHNDNRMSGHVMSNFSRLNNSYDKKLIVYESLYKRESYAFHYSKSLPYIIYKRIRYYYYSIIRRIKYGEWVKADPQHSEYCFYSHFDMCVSARRILRKIGDFIPDIITVHWVSDFISPKTIRDLYELTKATIYIQFIDEAPLSGGCHYHCSCEEYYRKCENCPALISGKKFAHDQMVQKINFLEGLPIVIGASRYDLEQALLSPVYRQAKSFEFSYKTEVEQYDKTEARERYGIDESEYVIFIGANDLKSKRKGIIYSINAINLFSKANGKVTVLILGHNAIDTNVFENNVRIIQCGFLEKNDLMQAFCAADVFLSSTIADSGPMMVNYAVALGIPVVSFRVGIANSIINHKTSGYLAEYLNSESLFEGLNYIFHLSKEEKERMSLEEKGIMEKGDKGVWIDQLVKLISVNNTK